MVSVFGQLIGLSLLVMPMGIKAVFRLIVVGVLLECAGRPELVSPSGEAVHEINTPQKIQKITDAVRSGK